MKKIYGTVTVGKRGQIIIPAEARKDLGIKPKDKLIVASGPGNDMAIIMPIKNMNEFLNQMMSIKTKIDTEITKKRNRFKED